MQPCSQQYLSEVGSDSVGLFAERMEGNNGPPDSSSSIDRIENEADICPNITWCLGMQTLTLLISTSCNSVQECITYLRLCKRILPALTFTFFKSRMIGTVSGLLEGPSSVVKTLAVEALMHLIIGYIIHQHVNVVPLIPELMSVLVSAINKENNKSFHVAFLAIASDFFACLVLSLVNSTGQDILLFQSRGELVRNSLFDVLSKLYDSDSQVIKFLVWERAETFFRLLGTNLTTQFIRGCKLDFIDLEVHKFN